MAKHRSCLEEMRRSNMALLQPSHAPQSMYIGKGVPVMLLLLSSRYLWLCGVLRYDPLKATVPSKGWTLLLWNL